jgi:uncharacterized lipoprotein YajG
MRNLHGVIVGAVGLLVLAGCQTPAGSGPAASASAAKPPANEVLQKATSLAVGNLAWESVSISEVTREGAVIKWVATTRSSTWRCQAAPDGSNSYCQR